MYFLALATDYDGTLAYNGIVEDSTVEALERFKATGRRLLLVTGRELPSLKEAFPHFAKFDFVVAENGAVLYDPATDTERPLASTPPVEFVRRLKERGVAPLSIGRSVVATWEPHQTTVLETIRELGLELQIIFNKGAVMILPPGVNKAVGLGAALREMEISEHNVVAVGDAENDHAFLAACGCAAAVANALPIVKESATIQLIGDHGAGVVELMQRICDEDAGIADPERHRILLGTDDGRDVFLEPYSGNVLIAGQSGIGKSTLATALTERMAEKHFEFCVFDPEGDYSGLENAISIGDSNTPPSLEETLKLLRQAETNVVINSQSLELAERPAFFANVLPQLSLMRSRTGRPHWLMIDEAHHLLPGPRKDVSQILPENAPACIFITVHPGAVSPDALKSVEVVVALGETGLDVIVDFCRVVGIAEPPIEVVAKSNEILVWWKSSGKGPRRLKPERPKQVHKRHTQKYAEGNVGEDRCFYFRGPNNALNLKAQNLVVFLQLAGGVDQITWMHHLHRGDYSHWFRSVIKDEALAAEASLVETNENLTPAESLRQITQAVSSRYTAAARDD